MKKIIRMLEILRKVAFYAILIFSGIIALVIWSIGSSGESLSNNQYSLIIIILVLWGIVGIDEVFLNRIEQIRKERDETKKEAAEREKIIMQSVKKKVEEVYSIVRGKDERIDLLKKRASLLEEKLPPKIKEEVEEELKELILPSLKKKKQAPSAETLIRNSF